MTQHPCPYHGLPDPAYWRKSVGEPALEQIDPIVAPKFQIAPEDKIATAGSCFAQHIARYLSQSGYNYLVTEPGNPILSEQIRASYNYGTFSARYGNLYTTRQLWQLIQRAYGLFTPVDSHWPGKNGAVIDPYRPYIQPGGFSSLAELEADRAQHLAAVRQIVETSDVFVFTLGLTECWENTQDGAIYPACPGCGVGSHDPQKHRFVNLGVSEVIADLEAAIAFMLDKNPSLKILLTVSPVPLIATYEPRHVLSSTVYSKSVLRVAAQALCDARPQVEYFPSFELITGNFTQGRYYEPDWREVRPEGVAHVMRCFFRHYLGIETEAPQALSATTQPAPVAAAPARNTSATPSQAAQLAQIVCDEERLLEE